MTWVWLIAAILSELAGTLSLRASDGFRRRLWLLPLAVGYGMAFVFLALALNAGMAVGVAYGVWTAAGISLIALLAHAIWKDPLTRKMIIGILLIAGGVVLVEVG